MTHRAARKAGTGVDNGIGKEYRDIVLRRIEDVYDQARELRQEVADLRKELADVRSAIAEIRAEDIGKLKVRVGRLDLRSGLTGALGGVLTVALTILVFYLKAKG